VGTNYIVVYDDMMSQASLGFLITLDCVVVYKDMLDWAVTVKKNCCELCGCEKKLL
jgi:hypothetical protein